MLPSRKHLQKESRVIRRLFNSTILSKKERYYGPLLPNGKYSFQPGSIPKEGFRFPSKVDWTKSRGRFKTEPLMVAPTFFDKEDRRKLSKGNHRFRKKYPRGEYAVFPDRVCVTAFERRMHARVQVGKVLDNLDPCWEGPFVSKILKDLISITPEIFRNCRQPYSQGIASQKFMGALQYLRRLDARINKGPEAQKESSVSRRYVDLFSSDSS